MSNIAIPCPACGRELKIRDRNLLGKKGKCPSCQHTFVLEEPSAMQLAGADSPVTATAPRWTPDRNPPPAFAPVTPQTMAGPAIAVASPAGLPVIEPVSAARLKLKQKQQAQRRMFMLVVGGIVAVFGAVGGYVFLTQAPPDDKPIRTGTSGHNAGQPAGSASQPDSLAAITASPTKGGPIPLEMIPAGARLLVHLRPSELWQPDSKGEEFRYCLGPLGEFVEAQMKTLCKFPPTAIEEVLFAWIPGPRGTPPDFVYVVRLKDDAKKSELIDAVGGERDDSVGHPIYRDTATNTAAVIVDLKTFAVGPAGVAEEMVNSIGSKNPLPDGVEELFPKSDRTRHVAVYFEPSAVLLDEEFLAPANARPFLREVMEWFGDDSEAVLWSLHLEDDRFYSDVLVRNKSGARVTALEERFVEKLDQLPKEMLAAVRLMEPKELGKRQVIGRVPAMAKVVAMTTVPSHGKRDVRLITSLPDRAAPNLALGTLLAWDESTRTDFNRKPAAQPGSDSGKLPATIAERLKKKIDVDFRRTPLQEAFAFIGEETKVTFEIDGDALKLSGYTKNMPQEFKMDQQPATEPLKKILGRYDNMCLVVDEQKKIALITTFPVAEQQGLKPYVFP